MLYWYVDGSCCGNGKENNIGGYGVVALRPTEDTGSGFKMEYAWHSQEENTTNNRMELAALLDALTIATTFYKEENCIIYSDSAYCVNMFNDWIRKWASNNWKRTGNKEVENLDLVQKIYRFAIMEFPKFSVQKVSGHQGVLGNEIADALATNNLTKIDKIFKENDLGHPENDFFDLQEKL